VALKSDAAAEKSKDRLSRDFWGCSIFDFYNNIGTNRTNRSGLAMSVDWGGPEVTPGSQTDAIDPERTSGQWSAMFLNWSKVTIRSYGRVGTGLFRPSVA
jgi:hypothetical protein